MTDLFFFCALEMRHFSIVRNKGWNTLFLPPARFNFHYCPISTNLVLCVNHEGYSPLSWKILLSFLVFGFNIWANLRRKIWWLSSGLVHLSVSRVWLTVISFLWYLIRRVFINYVYVCMILYCLQSQLKVILFLIFFKGKARALSKPKLGQSG